MRILFACIFLLSCLDGFPQKPLTLIIDTVDFIDVSDKNNFKINLTNQWFADLGEIDTTAIITTDKFPNFKTIVYLKTDSTNIQIPIDQQKGFLELSNVYGQDTIRINYLRQYSNFYEDTTKTIIEYYRVKNDIVSDKPYKVKVKEVAKKKKCKRKPPFKTMLIINGKKYFVTIQKMKSKGMEYMHGHGYKPRKTEKNYENYSGTRFYISSITERYINVIEVRIE